MSRNTLIALGVFVLLGVAWFATREPEVSVGMHKFELAPLGVDAVTNIEFTGVSFSKDNGTWMVAATATPGKKYVADENQVKALVQAVADLKAPDFVTERTEKHAELEVDSAKGVTLKSGPSRDLILGKASKNGGVYVRKAGSNDVYVSNGPLGSFAKKPLNDWRKKSVATLRLEDVKKVTIGTLTISTDDGNVWKAEAGFPEGFRFDPAAARRFAGLVTNLNADGFTEEAVATTEALLTAEAKDGKKAVLSLGAKQPDGLRPLRVEGDPQTYLVSTWVGDQFTTGLELFRDLRVAPFDPSKATKLTITSGGKKLVVATRDLKENAWKLVEPKTPPAGLDLDLNQVQGFVSRLSAQRAIKLAPEGSDVKSAAASFEVIADDGKPFTVSYAAPGTATPQETFARATDGRVYVTSSAEKTQLEKGVENFKRLPPPPQNMGQMQGLDQLPPEIRAQIEAQLRAQQMGQGPQGP